MAFKCGSNGNNLDHTGYASRPNLPTLIYIQEVFPIYTLGYGKDSLTFALPSHARADFIVYDEKSAGTPEKLIRKALLNPISSPRLSVAAKGRRSAVILISDMSRLCPTPLFLMDLIDELAEAGIHHEAIRVIVALGTHRKQSREELAELVGPSVYGRVEVLNHSCLPDDCVFAGTTSHGTCIEINRHVVEAELRVATGNIEPHGLAGMSGGAKALMPGVASERSISQNHALSVKQKAMPGSMRSLVRDDLEQALQFVPVHFLFNAIANHRGELIDAFAGDVLEAHRQGCETARQRFLVPVDKKYDLVIVSAGGYPKDIQLYQAVKTMQNASAILKPGGTLLMAARCQELLGNGILQHWVDTIQDRAVMSRMLDQQFVLGAHKIHHIDAILKKHRVCLYSDMPQSLVQRLGFEPVTHFQEAVDSMAAAHDQEIAIMPYGALTFPALTFPIETGGG